MAAVYDRRKRFTSRHCPLDMNVPFKNRARLVNERNIRKAIGITALLCGLGAFAEAGLDPSKIDDKVVMTLGQKLAIQFQVQGSLLKKPKTAISKMDFPGLFASVALGGSKASKHTLRRVSLRSPRS